MNELQNRLAAKVKAVNRANEEAIKWHKLLVAIFAPLVGNQLFKATGGLLEKYRKLLPVFPNTPSLYFSMGISNYRLSWVVKTCEMIEGTCGCLYHETTIDIGKLDNGVLTEMYDTFTARTDYTAEEITAKREAIRAAEKVLSNARSALYPFDENDR